MVTRRALLTVAAGASCLPALALDSELAGPLAAYEGETGGRIGLHAENVATGATIAWRADERFVMCSTFKASLAALVLSRVDQGRDRLDRMIRYGPRDIPDWHAPVAKEHLADGALSVAAMCQAIVEHSDNTCANLLLARVGGPAALTSFWRATGDATSRLDHNEPLLNRSPPGDPRDTTTPRAMAGTLRRLVLGNVLLPPSRDRLTGWLVDCKTGADRLRGGLPAHWRIGDKTGNNGKDAFGDIAVAWPTPASPVVVCAYTRGGSPTAPQVKADFAEIGRWTARSLV